MSDFLILHTLRVKGLTPLAVVSAQTGLSATQADEVLRRLAARGLVTMREGRMAGALLTPAGKQAHAEQLARDPGTRGAAAALAAAYEEFLPVNGEFKRICQSWQMRPDGQPNDHADAGFFEQLNRRGANTAAAAVNQSGLAALDCGEHEKIQEHCQKDFGNAGSFLETQRRGNLHRRAVMRDGLLRVAAAGYQCHRAIADLPSLDRIADRRDLARDFHANNFRHSRWRRVESQTL